MEQRTVATILCTLVLVLSGCLGVATSNPNPAENATGGLTADALNTTEIEQEIHSQVNQERSKRGLSALAYNESLHRVALYHSEDMVQQDYIAHTSPSGDSLKDRYEQFSIDCSVPTSAGKLAGGENIVGTYPDGKTNVAGEVRDLDFNESTIATAVVDGWMDSKGHRENILRPNWTTEGVGVFVGEIDNEKRVVATQNFC